MAMTVLPRSPCRYLLSELSSNRHVRDLVLDSGVELKVLHIGCRERPLAIDGKGVIRYAL